MKNTYLIASSIFLILFQSCTFNQDAEVKSKATYFLQQESKTDFRELDKSLFSKELANLIVATIKKEGAEEVKVKNSDFPTDKPLMIEGDIFTSLYEGQNTFEIKKIETRDNKSIVTVQFSNTTYKESWQDQLVLLKEGTWKVDNVIFIGNETEVKSTKDALKSFLAAE
jgi:hypothetical protein